jgi:biotin carboxyl carrier protein
MATITVQTKDGPVSVDEDQIEAWGGEILDAPAPEAPAPEAPAPEAPAPEAPAPEAPAPEAPAPKRKPKTKATDIAPAPVEGKFMLVDQDGKQFGDELYDSADAALEAMT